MSFSKDVPPAVADDRDSPRPDFLRPSSGWLLLSVLVLDCDVRNGCPSSGATIRIPKSSHALLDPTLSRTTTLPGILSPYGPNSPRSPSLKPFALMKSSVSADAYTATRGANDRTMICLGSFSFSAAVAGDGDRALALNERSSAGRLGPSVGLILWGRDFEGVCGKSGVEVERRPSIEGDVTVDAGFISGKLPEECFRGSVGRGSCGEGGSGLGIVVIGLVGISQWYGCPSTPGLRKSSGWLNRSDGGTESDGKVFLRRWSVHCATCRPLFL